MKSKFGGPWTVEKLDILSRYLQLYTRALKRKNFQLVYIDAFAGDGKLSYRIERGLDFEDADKLYDGSVKLAIAMDENPFDRFIFIEKVAERYETLVQIKNENQNRSIEVVNQDANEYLQNLPKFSSRTRGVLFLDPFATEVEWNTIKAVAGYEIFDTWLLFPTSSIARMLPKRWPSDALDTVEAKALTRVFGDDTWKNLYNEDENSDLWGGQASHYIRSSGVEPILDLFKSRLSNLLGQRFLTESRTLFNTKNALFFEFLFFVGNPVPAAIKAAKNIASYLIHENRS